MVFCSEAGFNLFTSQHFVQSQHIPGVRNQLADALSRLQVQTFRHLAPPHMDSLPTEIPHYLQLQSWVL